MTINSKQTYHIEIEISKNELEELRYIAVAAAAKFNERYTNRESHLTHEQIEESREYYGKAQDTIDQLDRILRGE